MPNLCFQTGDLDRSGVGHKAQQQGAAGNSPECVAALPLPCSPLGGWVGFGFDPLIRESSTLHVCLVVSGGSRLERSVGAA